MGLWYSEKVNVMKASYEKYGTHECLQIGWYKSIVQNKTGFYFLGKHTIFDFIKIIYNFICTELNSFSNNCTVHLQLLQYYSTIITVQ